MSILALKLQMQQRRQEQERAEILQREQMNQQKEMQGIDMMIRSGQAYFNAMKAADDRDLKLAMAEHQQRMNIADRERKDGQARAEAIAKLSAAGRKEKFQTGEREEKEKYYTSEKYIQAQERIRRAGAVAGAAARTQFTFKDEHKAANTTRDDLSTSVRTSIASVEKKIKAQELIGGMSMDPRMARWYEKLRILEEMKGRIDGLQIKFNERSVGEAQAEMESIARDYQEALRGAEQAIGQTFGIETPAEAPTGEAATIGGWASEMDNPPGGGG